jgi:hypothetical protein
VTQRAPNTRQRFVTREVNPCGAPWGGPAIAQERQAGTAPRQPQDGPNIEKLLYAATCGYMRP